MFVKTVQYKRHKTFPVWSFDWRVGGFHFALSDNYFNISVLPYPRSASPHHGFTIMNRLSTENLVEPINKDLEFQLQDPFLLYRNGNCEYFVE